MSTTRWLFVDGARSFGGHEIMLLRLMDELARQGRVRPRLLALAGTELRARAGTHATTHALPGGTPPAGPIARVRAALADAQVIWRTLRAERASFCVVAEGSVLSQPVPSLVCRMAGARLAVYLPLTQPTSEMGFRSGWLRDGLMKLGFADLPHAWIVLTGDQAASFAAWTGARQPIFVLPNTVAPEIEQRMGDALPYPTGEPLRVVVLGRLDIQQKGLDLLLDHVEQAGPSMPPLQLALVGDGPARDQLAARLARSPTLAARTRIAPWSDPASVLRGADLLLLPSRYEGVPLVMLEAMAMGVPVVASDLPGTRPFLTDACLFPVGRLDRAFAIVESLRDPAARARVAGINRAAFAAKASGAAFSTAVEALASRVSRWANGAPAPAA
ncbi:MAG: glycosyltransferase family 4 protein [Polyangia bacterium]